MTATKENTKPTLYKIVVETVHTTEPQEHYFAIKIESERYLHDEFGEVVRKVSDYFGPEFGDNGFIKSVERVSPSIVNL